MPSNSNLHFSTLTVNILTNYTFKKMRQLAEKCESKTFFDNLWSLAEDVGKIWQRGTLNEIYFLKTYSIK